MCLCKRGRGIDRSAMQTPVWGVKNFLWIEQPIDYFKMLLLLYDTYLLYLILEFQDLSEPKPKMPHFFFIPLGIIGSGVVVLPYCTFWIGLSTANVADYCTILLNAFGTQPRQSLFG